MAGLVARLLWVRLRAHPVDDTASKTKRSGQNFCALQALINFGNRKRATKAKNNRCLKIEYRGVAQLVARLLWEQDAAGSSPVTSTIEIKP